VEFLILGPVRPLGSRIDNSVRNRNHKPVPAAQGIVLPEQPIVNFRGVKEKYIENEYFFS
jgi:hypothetical protein